MSSAAAAAAATPAPRSLPDYGFCACGVRLVKGKMVFCTKCGWRYCDEECRRRDLKRHKKTMCSPYKMMDKFFHANATTFAIWGAWLKTRPDQEFVGVRVEIGEDEAADVTAIPLNQQSLEILLQKVRSKPEMVLEGYPHVFTVLIDYQGLFGGFGIDLVQNGKILFSAASPALSATWSHYIVPPLGVLWGETRQPSASDWGPRMMSLPFLNYVDWKRKRAATRQQDTAKAVLAKIQEIEKGEK